MAGLEIPVLFYSTIAGLGTLFGIWIIIRKQQLAVEYSHYLNSFAAGLIMALVFFHLIPEAAELTELFVFFSVFLGFFLFYLLENFIVVHSGSEIHYHEDEGINPHIETTSQRTGLMAFFGLTFHSLIDGVIIGVGFELNLEIGFLTSLAVILHEIPEGVTTFALINKTMPEKAKIFSIIVAIATPIGAIIILLLLFFIGNLDDTIIGILLAVAAGSFIYVAASDLIPETHQENNVRNLISFLLGSILIYLISLL